MKRLIIVAAGILLIASCKKEEIAETTTSGNNNSPTAIKLKESDYFYPLTSGNYWTYEWIESNEGQPDKIVGADSVWVEKDTIIDGLKYYKIWANIYGSNPTQPSTGPTYNFSYLREENGKIYNLWGESSAFPAQVTDTAYARDTTAQLIINEYYTRGYDSLVTVPAGTFKTINLGAKVIAIDPNYPFQKEKFRDNILAKGIGPIYNTCWYFNNPKIYFTKRLVKYKVLPK